MQLYLSCPHVFSAMTHPEMLLAVEVKLKPPPGLPSLARAVQASLSLPSTEAEEKANCRRATRPSGEPSGWVRNEKILEYPRCRNIYHHTHDKHRLHANSLWKKYKHSSVFSLPAALYGILTQGGWRTRKTILKINPFLQNKQRCLQWVYSSYN